MKRRFDSVVLLATIVGLTGPAAAQPALYPSNVGIEAGLSLAGLATGVLGLEVRQRIRGRVAVTGSVRRWFLEGGCDLLVGAPCYTGGWAPAVGLAVGLGRFARVWHPYVAGRFGPLRLNTDTTVWNANVGAGIIWMVGSRVGLQASVQYDALADRAAPAAYSPPTADRLVLALGLAIVAPRDKARRRP